VVSFCVWGGGRGGTPPPTSQKMAFFKAEGLISGWVGKIRNNRNFRIIGQGKKVVSLCFKISINAIKFKS